jgi:hypothetical protein
MGHGNGSGHLLFRVAAVLARRLLLTCLLTGTALAQPAGAPKRPPAAKAPSSAETTAINAAVAELKKEYAAHQKDPESKPLRDRSSYFLDNPAQVTPEAILAALDRTTANDPRLAAYLKWQLLSAVPEKFDPSLSPVVLDLYRKARQPPPRLGLSPKDQAKLTAALVGMRKGDDLAFNAKFEEAVAKDAAANRPVLGYRDELYAKLPPSYESLVAGFRDANERLAAGTAHTEFAERVVKDAQDWALTGAGEPAQYGQLADLVAKLRFVRGPAYYSVVRVRQDKPAWSTKTETLCSAKKLAALEKVLREVERANQPAADAGKAR